MVFDPKIVFGLCNVLNRHARTINLEISFDNSSQHTIEQWAKRMDLVYRDSTKNWYRISNDPINIVNDLNSIENLSSELIRRLYNVDPGIHGQLSKGLGRGGFAKFRTVLREKFDSLKSQINEVKLLFDEKGTKLLPESIGALDAIVDVWRSSEGGRRIPKRLSSNSDLYKFTKDCFKVFKIVSDPEDSYKNWYKLTQK